MILLHLRKMVCKLGRAYLMIYATFFSALGSVDVTEVTKGPVAVRDHGLRPRMLEEDREAEERRFFQVHARVGSHHRLQTKKKSSFALACKDL